MRASNKIVRQSVGLPAHTARQVRSLAKKRRLSANRIIVEFVEKGIEVQKHKEREFFELAERFRTATDPKDVARLGDDWAAWFLATDAAPQNLGQAAARNPSTSD